MNGPHKNDDCSKPLLPAATVSCNEKPPEWSKPTLPAAADAETWHRMQLALRAADEMARIIDSMVNSSRLDARSKLSDARLNYGLPWKYEWSRLPAGNGAFCGGGQP